MRSRKDIKVYTWGLSVQELAEDRLLVSTILSMLNSEIAKLHTPEKLTFIRSPIAMSLFLEAQEFKEHKETPISIIYIIFPIFETKRSK